MNGVFRSVMEEIERVQRVLPDQILYMQPHGSNPVRKLRDDPPTVERPVAMWISAGDDLQHVAYRCEIVGWEDKTAMSEERRGLVEQIIDTLQPCEGGLYDMAEGPGASSVNLLHVRRLCRIAEPFPVDELVKIGDGLPLSMNRTRGGGHAYVRRMRSA